MENHIFVHIRHLQDIMNIKKKFKKNVNLHFGHKRNQRESAKVGNDQKYQQNQKNIKNKIHIFYQNRHFPSPSYRELN